MLPLNLAADCSRTSDLSGSHKSPKLKDGQHLSRNSQVTLDMAMNTINSGQFKIRTKKMEIQVNYYFYLNASRFVCNFRQQPLTYV